MQSAVVTVRPRGQEVAHGTGKKNKKRIFAEKAAIR